MVSQCHIMPTVSSMAPFHLLGQDEQNEMQHDLFGHVLPLEQASASCNVTDIISGTTAFDSPDNMMYNMTFLVMWWICC